MLPTISNVPWQVVVEGAVSCFQSVFLWGKAIFELQYIVLVRGELLAGNFTKSHHPSQSGITFRNGGWLVHISILLHWDKSDIIVSCFILIYKKQEFKTCDMAIKQCCYAFRILVVVQEVTVDVFVLLSCVLCLISFFLLCTEFKCIMASTHSL